MKIFDLDIPELSRSWVKNQRYSSSFRITITSRSKKGESILSELSRNKSDLFGTRSFSHQSYISIKE